MAFASFFLEIFDPSTDADELDPRNPLGGCPSKIGLRLRVRALSRFRLESDPPPFPCSSSSISGGDFTLFRVSDLVTGPKYSSRPSEGVGVGDITRGVSGTGGGEATAAALAIGARQVWRYGGRAGACRTPSKGFRGCKRCNMHKEGICCSLA